MLRKNKNPVRSSSHHRVRAIMAAFDRIASSDARATNDIPDGDGLINTCFGGLFSHFDVAGWSDDSVRNVLVALVTNCPTFDLEIFEEWAIDQVEFVKRFEVTQRYSQITGKDLPHEVDQNALHRAFAGESTLIATIEPLCDVVKALVH